MIIPTGVCPVSFYEFSIFQNENIGTLVLKFDNEGIGTGDLYKMRSDLQIYDDTTDLEGWNKWIGSGNISGRGFADVSGDIAAVLINSPNSSKMLDYKHALKASVEANFAPVYQTNSETGATSVVKAFSGDRIGFGFCSTLPSDGGAYCGN